MSAVFCIRVILPIVARLRSFRVCSSMLSSCILLPPGLIPAQPRIMLTWPPLVGAAGARPSPALLRCPPGPRPGLQSQNDLELYWGCQLGVQCGWPAYFQSALGLGILSRDR